MARPAPIRLAGMIAATVTCAAAATEAQAQEGSNVLNNQLQLGDVFSHQTLNVVDAQEQVTVSNGARGNSLIGAVQNDSLTIDSTQDMRGDAIATTVMDLGGDTVGPVNAVTQAGGNYLGASAYDSDLTVNASQVNSGGEVQATSSIDGGTARLLGGAQVGVSAIGNTIAVAGQGSSVGGALNQESSATVRGYNYAATQYIPATASFTSQAIANAVAVNSDAASNQVLAIRQRSTGDLVDADTSANAGNAWDLASRAHASGNQAILANQGGSVVVETDQANAALVRARAVATSYDFGRAEAYAHGAGNEASIGNNDIWLQIDNAQVNTGGVEATATFSGTNGYDAYVGADAVGNAVTGYACSECAGVVNAVNSQTNDGSVSATANTNVAGSGRAVITGTNAIGNSATFYVTRPGQ